MSNLKLNGYIEKFKEFYGKNTEQMSKLLEEGRHPLSTAGLMEMRLEFLAASEEVKNAWWNNSFDTGDAIIYHPDGKFKVVTGNNAEPFWKELKPNKRLKGGALILPEGLYDKLDGETFLKEEVRRYRLIEKRLTMEEAKNNPIWKALAGGDQALLEDYVDAVFKKGFMSECTRMRISLEQLHDVTTGRLWTLIESKNNRFNAVGFTDLNFKYNRLVGVAPKARKASFV